MLRTRRGRWRSRGRGGAPRAPRTGTWARPADAPSRPPPAAPGPSPPPLGNLAGDGRDLALEVAQACLAGIAADQEAQGLGRPPDVLAPDQATGGRLLG